LTTTYILNGREYIYMSILEQASIEIGPNCYGQTLIQCI